MLSRFFYPLIATTFFLLPNVFASTCPVARLVHYNASNSRYEAKTDKNTLLQSTVVAALVQQPQMSYLGAVATGEQNSATLHCNYQVGNNTISLKRKTPVKLSNHGWKMLPNQAGIPLYYCKKNDSCTLLSR